MPGFRRALEGARIQTAVRAVGVARRALEVLGYRGMREYALQFDALTAPGDALLGGEEGQDFKQLMRAFVSC